VPVIAGLLATACGGAAAADSTTASGSNTAAGSTTAAGTAAGSASSSPVSTGSTGSSTPTAGSTAAGGPVTIADDCGRSVVIPHAPTRAVALEQGATEVMLSLGLAKSMAGTSYLTDPVLPALAGDYATVPVLSAQYPSPEQFRSTEPDFVYSMLPSAFTAEVAGTRAELTDLGVPAYVSRFGCEDPARSADFAFDGLFGEITDIGAAFGVPERAAELVAGQRATLETASRTAGSVPAGLTVAWLYSTYNGAPIVAGAGGVPAEMSRIMGLRNVFDDLDKNWSEVTWESIADRNPDVIVLADLSRGRPGDSAADKRQILRADPVASKLTAVTADHLVSAPGSALDPSIRSADAVAEISSAITALDLKGPAR
jgi:iron complex transport system substrate-binding protein